MSISPDRDAAEMVSTNGSLAPVPIPSVSLDDLSKQVGLGTASFEVQYEPPDVTAKRQELERERTLHQHQLEIQNQRHENRIHLVRSIQHSLVMSVGLGLIAGTMATCTYIILFDRDDSAQAEKSRHWAGTLIASVVTAAAGYAFGKNSQT